MESDLLVVPQMQTRCGLQSALNHECLSRYGKIKPRTLLCVEHDSGLLSYSFFAFQTANATRHIIEIHSTTPIPTAEGPRGRRVAVSTVVSRKPPHAALAFTVGIMFNHVHDACALRRGLWP